MAVFNEKYIQEFLFKKKKYKDINRDRKDKNRYSHLEKDEITKIISIAKKEILRFPKLNKATEWLDLNKSINGEDEEPSLLNEYFKSSGNAELIIATGDAWDGYPTLRTNWEDFTDDQEFFCKNVELQLKENNIQAKFYPTGGADWDGIEFAIKSTKIKNNKSLNESAIGVGILSYLILNFAIIASLLIGSKIDDTVFNKLLNKYPQLKKSLQNMIDKTSDIFYKNCNNKLKVIKLEKSIPNINKSNTKINTKKNTASYNYSIYSANLLDQMRKSNFLDYDSMSSFICGDEFETYIYLDTKDKEFLKFEKENLEEANTLKKEYKTYVKAIKDDINIIKNVISSMDDELKNISNGNIIKLSYWDGIDDFDRSKAELEEIKNNDIIPIFIDIYIEIYVNNIKMTDEIKEKVNELRIKSGKYLKN